MNDPKFFRTVFRVDGWEIAVRNAWNTSKPGQFQDIETMLKVRLHSSIDDHAV